MTISTDLYRYWREATHAGLTITPAYRRDPATGQVLDHAYDVTGPRPEDTARLVIADLESWLAAWLSDLYATEPGARARAADHAMRMSLDRTAT